MRNEVASGLADAMLAGPPAPDLAVARCALVLGADVAWLRPLTAALLGRFGDAWYGNIRRQLIAAILASPDFDKGWRALPQPRVVRPNLEPPRMAPPPPWLAVSLPELPNRAALARFLDLDAGVLEALLRSLRYRSRPETRRLRHYSCRWQEKRSGGYRLLEIPKPRLRGLQRRILRGILDQVPPHPAAHGFRAGHSCLDHAGTHAGQPVVIRLDLADFFLHVGAARVRAVFRRLGYPDGVADALAELCTCRTPETALGGPYPGLRPDGFPPHPVEPGRYRSPHLPQGAPTSPALANLAAWGLDVRLQAAMESLDGRYTRYADDLAISGGPHLRRMAGRLIPWLGAIARDEGFNLNFRKTRVMGRGTRQVLTGLVVNVRPNAPREDYERLKAILHNCNRQGPASQTDLPLPLFRQQLTGRVAQMAASNPARGRRLAEWLAAIDWEVS